MAKNLIKWGLAVLGSLSLVLSGNFPVLANTASGTISRQDRQKSMTEKSQWAPGEVLVRFRDNTKPDTDMLQTFNVEEGKNLGTGLITRNDRAAAANTNSQNQSGGQPSTRANRPAAGVLKGLEQTYVFKLEPGQDVTSAVSNLKQDSRVELAEPNYIVHTLDMPNDPEYGTQWAFKNTGQNYGTPGVDIKAEPAWSIAKETNVTVGVIDTGIDYNHPDLKDNIWTNPGEIPNNGIDDDSNGFIDDYYGWDFFNNDNDPYDDFGHGTHVAGTIAAKTNNGIGVAGVNWTGKVAALKFIGGSGYGFIDDAVKALAYANMMGFKITNNSWGGGGFSQALYDEIAKGGDKNNLFIAAAGNEYSNNDSLPFYPASYNLPNVISVAATDSFDNKAAFSNYGTNSVHLGAPGVDIMSTLPGYGYMTPTPGGSNLSHAQCALCSSTGYGSLSGTSMAAPHVSGALALYWAQHPHYSYNEVEGALFKSLDITQTMQQTTKYGGRLNLYNLLENDTVAPAPIVDLSATSNAPDAPNVTLKWTAPGDDSNTGQAAFYELRLAKYPLNQQNFYSAPVYNTNLKPKAAGSPETYVVQGLDSLTTYYFMIRTRDNAGNWSEVSNQAQTTTKLRPVIFADGFENSTTSWTTTGLWHLESHQARSGQKSFAYNTGYPLYNYDTGSQPNSGTLTSPVIDLTNVQEPALKFYSWFETEQPYGYFDTRRILIGVDGVFTQYIQDTFYIPRYWYSNNLDLSLYQGKKIQIRFAFDTVDSVLNNYEGWYIDDLSVTGIVPNRPPTLSVASKFTAMEDSSLTLSAKASDLDGDPLTYFWNFGDQTPTQSSEQTSQIPHTYTKGGNYPLNVFVTDGHSTTTASSTVAVTEVNDKPIADAGPDLSGFVSQTFDFNASKSSDEEGSLKLYVWAFGDGTTFPSTSPLASHSYGNRGTYSVSVTVYDAGNLSASDFINVTVVNDSITISQADYSNSLKKLTVTATSDGSPGATLTANEMPMTYNPATGKYTASLSYLFNPGFVAVRSSYGGRANQVPAMVN